ncbi:hypothetical protein FOIG_13027 [Fusarium odoratissimum NRRL 54006]|uniref:Uncharacterized protein n=1 Tax=Fusarium odoratissimum (strain NRRL 54006) TaxID=1089451 RepID=X0JCP7_FUSO5|nr:uncharacterized protein FOIG_13027 [Fusarium odoratissimum NRRL 54006]EXL94120.1 hypothetical protein FOIG_13027 [Fusarium odoratissimum NRRL 54006]
MLQKTKNSAVPLDLLPGHAKCAYPRQANQLKKTCCLWGSTRHLGLIWHLLGVLQGLTYGKTLG